MSEIHGRLNATTGELYEVSRRPATYPDDVPLADIPSGFGPFGYDAGARQAVSSTGLLAQKARGAAQALLDQPRDGLPNALRTLILILLDEVNALRQRDRDRTADVAAAGSLAALKTAWAARPALADRTGAQARAAFAARNAAGDGDN